VVTDGQPTFLIDKSELYNCGTDVNPSRGTRALCYIQACNEDTIPANQGQDVERRIAHGLPDALRQVFLREAGGLKFRWNTDVFGAECKRGCAWLLSPEEMAEAFKGQVGIAEEARRDGLDATSEGYRALVTDWPRQPTGQKLRLKAPGGPAPTSRPGR
jgi:hypothetical protein